jgi:hypothetical protein
VSKLEIYLWSPNECYIKGPIYGIEILNICIIHERLSIQYIVIVKIYSYFYVCNMCGCFLVIALLLPTKRAMTQNNRVTLLIILSIIYKLFPQAKFRHVFT